VQRYWIISLQNAGLTIMVIYIEIRIYSINTGTWQGIHHVVLTIWCADDMHFKKFVEQSPMQEMATPTYNTHTRTTVRLLNSNKLYVGDGYLSNVTAGEVLHTRVLLEDEVVVYVTNVFDSACEVQEPFQDYLGECVHTMIRWKCENLLFEEGDGMRELQDQDIVHTNAFSTFEWMEEGGPSNTFEGCLSQEYEQRKKFWDGQIREENRKSIPTEKVREDSTQLQVQFEPELPDT
jgi:hypothetical protein